MRRRPVVDRFGRLIEYRRVNGLPSGRLLPLHAFQRGDQLPRPRQQRSDPQGELSATRGHHLQVPVGPERLQAPAPERRPRAEPSRSCSRCERRGCGSPSACAPTASHSLTPTAAAASPTLPRSESIRVRHSSRPQTRPAGSTGRPTCPRMPNTTPTPRRRGHERGEVTYRGRHARVCPVAGLPLRLTVSATSTEATIGLAGLADRPGARRRGRKTLWVVAAAVVLVGAGLAVAISDPFSSGGTNQPRRRRETQPPRRCTPSPARTSPPRPNCPPRSATPAATAW